MSIFDITSHHSLSKGFQYYESKYVSKLTKINDTDYEAIVTNSENHEYHVRFNTKHPRKSTCDCPHAARQALDAKRVIIVPGFKEKIAHGLLKIMPTSLSVRFAGFGQKRKKRQ